MRKTKLNVLKYGYLHAWSFYAIWNNIKQFFRNIKYAYQRITKGYCDFDIWDMNCYLSDLMYEMLNDLANKSNGYPAEDEFSDEQAAEDGFIDGYSKWQRTLKDMADHFYNTQERDDLYLKIACDEAYEKYRKHIIEIKEIKLPNDCFTTEEVFDDKELAHRDLEKWQKANSKLSKFIEAEKNKACDMLKKYFFNLWD